MSILLVGAEGAVGEAVVARLIEQGDEVRVIEPVEAAADLWRTLGAHVARGSADDADLVERAAQNARTVVVLGTADLEPILHGAAAAGVGRLVLCTSSRDGLLEEAALDRVVLVVPTTRLRRRPSLAPEAIAEAIDAADDLAGHPRLVADLGDASGWRALGLEPPPDKGGG